MTRLRYGVTILFALLAVAAFAGHSSAAVVVTRISGTYSSMSLLSVPELAPPFSGFGIKQFSISGGLVTSTFRPSPLSAGGTLSDIGIDLTPFVSNLSPGNTVDLFNPANGSSIILTMPGGESPQQAQQAIFSIQSATIFSNDPAPGATIRAQVTLEENFISGIDLSVFAISGGTLTINIVGATVVPTNDGFIPTENKEEPPEGISFTVGLKANAAVIPEPMSAGFWLFGLAVAGWLCRPRKKSIA
jgi:hypothetical protein